MDPYLGPPTWLLGPPGRFRVGLLSRPRPAARPRETAEWRGWSRTAVPFPRNHSSPGASRAGNCPACAAGGGPPPSGTAGLRTPARTAHLEFPVETLNSRP